jgi:hypothetical protein
MRGNPNRWEKVEWGPPWPRVVILDEATAHLDEHSQRGDAAGQVAYAIGRRLDRPQVHKLTAGDQTFHLRIDGR